MKITIYYTNTEHAWGGGNQFLKALKAAFCERGVYAASSGAADAVLFNSYQEIGALIRSFIFHPKILRAYRLGPIMSLHRNGIRWKAIDYITAFVATYCAEVVIFQSQWSLNQMKRFGFHKRTNVYVIPNAVDERIFHPAAEHAASSVVRLIYTSWSKNIKKGFSTLTWLDEHIDHDRYSITFVGNSPTAFRSIHSIDPLPSAALADTLRDHDIFISPTQDDACSNAILEALSCGLPVVALNSGGNGEIVQQGGELYVNHEELLAAIDRVAGNLHGYRTAISAPTIARVADRYIAAVCGSITP